jgi:hypothetical protein
MIANLVESDRVKGVYHYSAEQPIINFAKSEYLAKQNFEKYFVVIDSSRFGWF